MVVYARETVTREGKDRWREVTVGRKKSVGMKGRRMGKVRARRNGCLCKVGCVWVREGRGRKKQTREIKRTGASTWKNN